MNNLTEVKEFVKEFSHVSTISLIMMIAQMLGTTFANAELVLKQIDNK